MPATQIKQFYYGDASEIGQGSSALSARTRWVTGQNGTSMGGLDAAESLQLLWLDRNLSTKANLSGGPLDERDTIGVQRLVDGGDTRSGLDQGNASSPEGSLIRGTTFATLADVLDDSGFHRKLDEIEREEPNNILMKWLSMRSRTK